MPCSLARDQISARPFRPRAAIFSDVGAGRVDDNISGAAQTDGPSRWNPLWH
jgi:hypothetical protein